MTVEALTPASGGALVDGVQEPGCALCGSEGAEPILRLTDVPVLCNVLWDTEEEARRAPTGDVDLVSCRACGAMRNRAFDERKVQYSPAYANSLHASPRFTTYAEELASRLIDTYSLRGATVAEIGSGRGDFLELLCARGAGRGHGFDPSYGGFRGRRLRADHLRPGALSGRRRRPATG